MHARTHTYNVHAFLLNEYKKVTEIFGMCNAKHISHLHYNKIRICAYLIYFKYVVHSMHLILYFKYAQM